MATALDISTAAVEETETPTVNGEVKSQSDSTKMDGSVNADPPPVNPTGSNWFKWLPSWKPTSEDKLQAAEDLVLSNLKSEYTDRYVPIGNGSHVRTISMTPEESSSDVPSTRHPLVMVHGFGGGLCCFYKNYDYLHLKRHLHAFDVLGFGRSTRAEFGNQAEVVEDEFVESIEKWRQAMGIEKMILLGHSLGSYMSTAYAMKYPERVRHLVLVDTWGFIEEPEELNTTRVRRYRFLIPILKAYFRTFNPFAMVRTLGPIGPNAISSFRPDLSEKFGSDFMDYVYHCNAQSPTGESAFFHMQSNLTYSKRPMVNRLDSLPPSLPMSMLFGRRSWFDPTAGELVYSKRPGSFVDVHYIEEAGHHIHADLPDTFNRIVNGICEMVDDGRDVVIDGETRDERIAFHTHSS